MLIQGSGYKVETCQQESLAHSKGLSPGCTIFLINGNPAYNYTHARFLGMLLQGSPPVVCEFALPNERVPGEEIEEPQGGFPDDDRASSPEETEPPGTVSSLQDFMAARERVRTPSPPRAATRADIAAANVDIASISVTQPFGGWMLTPDSKLARRVQEGGYQSPGNELRRNRQKQANWDCKTCCQSCMHCCGCDDPKKRQDKKASEAAPHSFGDIERRLQIHHSQQKGKSDPTLQLELPPESLAKVRDEIRDRQRAVSREISDLQAGRTPRDPFANSARKRKQRQVANDADSDAPPDYAVLRFFNVRSHFLSCVRAVRKWEDSLELDKYNVEGQTDTDTER